jgi:hypothetical protein
MGIYYWYAGSIIRWLVSDSSSYVPNALAMRPAENTSEEEIPSTVRTLLDQPTGQERNNVAARFAFKV